MSGAELQVALIGCGRLAELGYLPALAAAPGLCLTAVADPAAPRRQRIAALAPGVDTHSSVGELLGAVRPEAAIVAGPVGTHLESARELAAAGIPALVEKPPAPDAARARELAALRPAPWVGFNRRFTLGRGLERLAARGAGGLTIEAAIDYRLRSWSPVGGLGDAWLDLGPHLLDLALLAAGPVPLRPTRVRLLGTEAEVELGGEGVTARLRCRTDAPHRELFRVRDRSGATLLERRAGGLRGLLARATRAPHPLHASLLAELSALRSELTGEPAADGPVLATADDGARVMELHDLARERAGADPGRPAKPVGGALAR